MTVKDFEHLICEFMKSYKEKYGLVTDWRTPIVGVANANDELFQMLKNIVGPTHVLPGDIVPNAKSVITFFIPFSRDIVLSNVENEESSKAWDYACIETNRMIGALSEYLYNVIRDTGV